MGESLLPLIVSGIVLGSIYGLSGFGFSVVYRATGAINFAQGEFVVLGAFLGVTLTEKGIPYFAVAFLSPVLLSAFVLIVFYLFLSKVTEEPLRLVVATIALSLILKTLALYFWGREPLGLSSPFAGRGVEIGGIIVTADQLLIIGAVILTYLFLKLLFNSYTGKLMQAVVEERELATAAGLNPNFYQALSFFLASFLGGFAGVAIAPVSMLSYQSGGLLGLKGFAAAVFAGLDNPERSFLGGIIIGILESLAILWLPSGYKDLVALVVLLLVLSFRPYGFFAKSKKRVA